MQVEWLKTALKNLDEEAAYIALDNPAAAAAFVKAIQSSVTQLASFPPWAGKDGLPEPENGLCQTCLT